MLEILMHRKTSYQNLNQLVAVSFDIPAGKVLLAGQSLMTRWIGPEERRYLPKVEAPHLLKIYGLGKFPVEQFFRSVLNERTDRLSLGLLTAARLLNKLWGMTDWRPVEAPEQFALLWTPERSAMPFDDGILRTLLRRSL